MAPSSSIFSLEGKGLRLDTAADLEPHIKPLHDSCDTYTEVRFNGNTFGVGACELLGQVLRKQTKLHTANLADIFTSRLLSEIPPALSSLLGSLLDVKTLQTVDLSDNAFGLNTSAPLVEFIKAHVPLRHFILNNNGLGPKAGALVAEAISELCARKNKAREDASITYEVPALETIVCGRNRLESGSMAAWARAIYDIGGGLRTLRMAQNGIRQEGITLLIDQGLRHARNIEVLDMQDNTFTKTGSRMLADAVTGWNGLRELGLGDCFLTGRGGLSVLRALGKAENKGIEVLKLGFNEITADGIKVLSEIAEGALPKLKRVELNGNKFEEEDESIVKLRELLEERKENIGKDEPEEEWGIDELDELEEESEDEEESEEEEEVEKKAEKALKTADQEENKKVAQKADKEVDDLAAQLAGTKV